MAGEKGDKTPRRKREPKAPNEQRPDEQPVQAGQPAEPEAPDYNRAPCPVVGVGASAGGLEALQGMFASLPSELNVAFVVVQHRATDRTSVMKSLIEKHTRLAVKDIEDGVRVEPNTIYLAPADKDVSIMHGVLFLVEPPPHSGAHLPIDAFLRTLARDEAERAIAIILSGTGSDGTLGLREIKAAGGMAMVQKEEQAKYDSMPRSAIETGMVDFILPVEKMGEQLAQYMRHPYLEQRKTPEPEEKSEDQLQRIFLLIRNQTGHDFSHYKRNTIRRRIARRLAVHQIEDLDHYIKLLQERTEEVEILAREMLITVTNFFRDREAWDALAEQVIRPLVIEKPPEVPLRVWVAGCATGEEAYTVAILFHEQMARDEKHHLLQIFATDLDEESVNTGRRGLYPKSIAADVSQTRLKRFFIEEGNSYKIKNNIRETIVFAKHNLIKDAPFSKLDLACCRNILIYMDNTLQKKLIPMFHYTLNPGAILFLGESESIGTFADLFAPVDAKHKIFRRKPVEAGYDPEAAELGYHREPDVVREKPRAAKTRHDVAEVAEHVILRDYSLPCVLVDEEFNIVYFNGDTSPYLMQPSGKPTTNIIQMARPEIHFKLNLLLKRAFHEKRLAMEKDIQIRANEHYFETDIVVRPVAEAGADDNLMLVVFKSHLKEKKPESAVAVPLPTEGPGQEKGGRIRELEQELQSSREYLQTTIEELETSNEELKSSNEELQSTNEELQSTNEELDTSREELQSTNEELRTVNSEHQQKIDELSKAYDDLNNLLGATEVATLFLDRDLRIRRFTPAARKIFRLMERDVGRPLDDISTNLQCPDLLTDIRSVLETLTRVDKEIACDSGEWYQMRVIPYRTTENVIEGTVITFVDVSDQKKLLETSKQAAGFAEAIVETVRQPLLILDQSLRVVGVNPAFCRHFRVRPEETLGRRIYELGNNQWDIPELRKLLEDIIPQNTRFDDYQVRADFPQIGERTMLLNARQTVHKGETTGRILLAFEDITGQTQA
ncbi:MAG: PAS domain-containing protein [Planctomycetes bacterium]|nr:PAS domain-containing protein [Planctomycetota bacterium]